MTDKKVKSNNKDNSRFPEGMTDKKSKGNDKNNFNGKGKGKSGPFAVLRMTILVGYEGEQKRVFRFAQEDKLVSYGRG